MKSCGHKSNIESLHQFADLILSIQKTDFLKHGQDKLPICKYKVRKCIRLQASQNLLKAVWHQFYDLSAFPVPKGYNRRLKIEILGHFFLIV